MSLIVAFIAGTGTDHRQRSLADILAWDDRRLEEVHDYIQWLFPLPEASAFNPWAPVLSRDDIAALRADPASQANLLASFRRILGFYGFTLADGIEASPDHDRRVRAWLTPGNHNFLRITRILRSLHLLGLPAEAAAFRDRLMALSVPGAARIIGPTTLRYWQAALS